MDSGTFTLYSLQTVDRSYKWDDGVPLAGSYNLITDTQKLSSYSANNDNNVEYVGTAPFFNVTFSSLLGSVPISSTLVTREVDFGDEYNNEFNTQISSATGAESFCHVYIMPGLYTVTYKKTAYVSTNLNEDLLNDSTIYVEGSKTSESKLFSYQWFNLLSDSPNNSNNKQITWNEAMFAGSQQFNWAQTSGICVEKENHTLTTWKWDFLVSDTNANPQAKKIKWNDTKQTSPLFKTWNSAMSSSSTADSSIPSISSTEIVITKQALIRVVENNPVAYLSLVSTPASLYSPVTVRLTPRYTKSGSFPIEKIVWDFGDGSPIIIKRRQDKGKDYNWIYNGAYESDPLDPRNYDIEHTYTRSLSGDFMFYPTITVYSSSTGTSDCASIGMGPILYPEMSSVELVRNMKVIQTAQIQNKKALVTDINNTLAVWQIP